MKRNLRFWTRHTWESAGVELALVALLALLTALTADSVQLTSLAAAAPYFLLVSGCLCILMINYSSQILYIPLLLSMGETRRNLFFGFHYYRCLVIAVTLGISALIWALVPCEVSSTGLRSIPTILVVLVIASAFGSLIGTTYAKCKWLSIVFIVLICGGIGGLFGFFFSGGASELTEVDLLALARYLERLPWWLVLAAAVLLLVDGAFQWLLLRRQEVKL